MYVLIWIIGISRFINNNMLSKTTYIIEIMHEPKLSWDTIAINFLRITYQSFLVCFSLQVLVPKWRTSLVSQSMSRPQRTTPFQLRSVFNTKMWFFTYATVERHLWFYVYTLQLCVGLKKKSVQLYMLTEDRLSLVKEIALPEMSFQAVLCCTVHRFSPHLLFDSNHCIIVLIAQIFQCLNI